MTSYTLFVGQSVPVYLEGNPTTGYDWVPHIRGDQNAIAVHSTYVPTNDDLIGSGGRYVITVTAIAPGKASLILFYEQPWEGIPAQIRQYVFTVNPLLGNVGGRRRIYC